MRPARVSLGQHRVFKHEDAVRLADGTLAGSILTMNRALRNLLHLGVPLEQAARRCATLQAEHLGSRSGAGWCRAPWLTSSWSTARVGSKRSSEGRPSRPPLIECQGGWCVRRLPRPDILAGASSMIDPDAVVLPAASSAIARAISPRRDGTGPLVVEEEPEHPDTIDGERLGEAARHRAERASAGRRGQCPRPLTTGAADRDDQGPVHAGALHQGLPQLAG